MIKKFYPILFVALLGCRNQLPQQRLTKLEDFVISQDSVRRDNQIFDEVTLNIQKSLPKIIAKQLSIQEGDTTGRVKEQAFELRYDSLGQSPRSYSHLQMIEYVTERKAAEAFEDVISFHACCIPNEDRVKLLNFKNLSIFKNSASTTYLVGNVILKEGMQSYGEDTDKLVAALDKIFSGKKYLKLDISNGGPAIWTIR